MARCVACNNEIIAGTRWCGICHINVVNPKIGHLASPAKRLGAYILDLLIPLVALFLIMLFVGLGASTAGEEGGAVTGLIGLALFVAYIIWALVLFSYGTTPGKNLLRMRVITENGNRAGFLTMLIREWIGKPISGMILLMGYIWILVDREYQGMA